MQYLPYFFGSFAVGFASFYLLSAFLSFNKNII